jgi:phosphatidylinositol alpha-1,6-mannosyltransferase
MNFVKHSRTVSRPTLPPQSILFAATSLKPGTGGIQRVARLMARVLLDEEFAPPARLNFLALFDEVPAASFGAPVRCLRGSRLGLVMRSFLLGGTHLITDACNLGQLHRVPRLRRKPYLTFLHGIEIWENAKPRWVRSAKAATVQVFNSNFTRRRAEELHGPFPRASVCWLATEADHAPPPRTIPPAPEVLIVGRIGERYKGHEALIDAWPRVVAAVPGATLRIAGRGPGEAELKARAARSGAGASIVFEGFVSDERLDDLYARAAAFAMPSRGEGFGLVYIEAMRHGLPVIASCHDAAQEVVLDGVTGYTVDLDVPDQLAARVVHLLRDPDLAGRMGEAGRRRWAEHFRYSCFRTRFREILARFLRAPT